LLWFPRAFFADHQRAVRLPSPRVHAEREHRAPVERVVSTCSSPWT
jgi:hypothetical protein